MDEMKIFRRGAGMAGVVLLAACGGRVERVQPTPDAGEAALAPAPWSAPMLDASSVPPVYLAQWRVAENRATCALIAPVTSGRADATPRAASIAGGWAVAYDTPELRSAFGVAGAGVSVQGDVYDGWPHNVEWSDGSSAGYGPEGGTGPNQLAFVEIAGQDCLYNVWSRLGVDHLEWLLGQLRFVRS